MRTELAAEAIGHGRSPKENSKSPRIPSTAAVITECGAHEQTKGKEGTAFAYGESGNRSSRVMQTGTDIVGARR